MSNPSVNSSSIALQPTWGLHLFKSSIQTGLESGSYFVERSYASFMVFPPAKNSIELKKDNEFLESKGGLAFLFHLYQDRPNDLQKALYQRFGCPLICPWQEDHFNKLVHENYEFRYGKFGVDFYDHQVNFVEVEVSSEKADKRWVSPALVVNKNKLSFIFLGAPWILDRGQFRHGPTGSAVNQLKIMDEPGKLLSEKSYLIFQFFRGPNWSSADAVVS